jgi:NDP-sugar pyrophosphorylase family protein
VKAVILVGGLGTRLRPLTFSIPKPLLPVGDKPLLQIVIEYLRAAGVDEIVLATGHHAELIRAFCEDGRKFGVEIDYVDEREPLGTAGPLSLVRGRFSASERFIVMNGDVLAKPEFRQMVQFAERHGYELTVGYTRHVYESPFGVLSLEDDRVVRIVEKPRSEYPISAGIYVVSPSVLDLVPDATFFTMPELITALISSGRPVGAYHIDQFWIGLETIAAFDEALEQLQTFSNELEGR